MTTSSIPLVYVCHYCGTRCQSKRRGAQTVSKYCNKDCYHAAQHAAGAHRDERSGARYYAWHAAVVARDKACQGIVERDGVMQRCGRTDDLHAHHIKHWATHVADRFAVASGILLCYDCHAARHARRGVGPRRPVHPVRTCAHCGVPITRYSKTGLCYRHALDAYSASHAGRGWALRHNQGRTCQTCGVLLEDRNRSGYCRAHMGPYISATRWPSKAP